jgi:adenine-specific DNA-methyltransferase
MADTKCKTMTMEERKALVARLVQQFRENEDYYLSKNFVESETRSKFIEPFLEALAWDVRNEKGARHDKQEVIFEDRARVDGKTKHPDYTLCYGGVRKMYVEAKQPSIDLKKDPKPALQVRRYAYSSKMPIAILTDFQELAIYDTRIKPKQKDTADTALLAYYTYDQYVEKFDELFQSISHTAVDLGTFDTYYESSVKKTKSVDKDVLGMIEEWRKTLAEDIALHNEDIDEFNLTSAVQKIIDRILFLRICEDKEIEAFGRLKEIADSRTNIYNSLKVLFSSANKKYNAGLFATDTYLNSLTIQDRTLNTLINALYQPVCQYEFSVLPVEILGSIYEQFLGKTIRFTRKTKNGHRIEIVDKPEVQKAGGVYYTPPYIVRYIVQQTIGRLIEGKTPKEISKMRFIDIACGSGSFLVGAYSYLLDWHLNYYLDDINASEKAGKIYKDDFTKEYKLAIEEKKAILLNNIYGVDIDEQAKEVTKLSLFLKLLENEGKSLSSNGQGELFRKSEIQAKILPSLMDNIKCGNSLVDSDYYADKDLKLFGIEEQRKINAFDWKKEFKAIFQTGGFDCVIGNPPYVKEYVNKDCFEGLYDHPCYQGKMDLWYLFGCKAIEILKKNGLVGFIATNNWNTNAGASKFRNFILDNAKLLKFVDFGDYKVFENASIQTMIYVMQNTKHPSTYSVSYSRFNKAVATQTEAEDYLFERNKNECTRFTSSISKSKFYDKYILFVDEHINNVLNTIKQNAPKNLEKAELAQGIVTPQDFCMAKVAKEVLHDESLTGKGIFILKQKEVSELNLSNEERKLLKPFYTSDQLHRYYGDKKNTSWLIYTTSEFKNKKMMLPYPHLKAHLDVFAKVITSSNGPYGLHRARKESVFTGEKILSLRKVSRPTFTYTDFDCYVLQSYNVIKTDRWNAKALTALLNSNVVSFWLRYKGKMQGDNYQIDREPLLSIPLTNLNEKDSSQLASLVEQQIDALRQSMFAKSDADKKLFADRCQITEKQINVIVYKLYGLTCDEIDTIESLIIK